jgi:hypothetical protein
LFLVGRPNAASKPSMVAPKSNVGTIAHLMATPNAPGAVKAPRACTKEGSSGAFFSIYPCSLLWSLSFYDKKPLVLMVSGPAYSNSKIIFHVFVLPS